MTRVLLTGASGFVGRQITGSLIKLGVDVVPVLRLKNAKHFLEEFSIKEFLLTEDVFAEDELWFSQALKDVDVVIHAAWYVEPGKYLESEKNIHCLTGSINLASAAIKAGVKRFIGIGTCFEYALTENSALTIASPLQPETLYAASKASLYLILNNLFKEKNVEFAWCRLFYLHGEGEDSRRLAPYIKRHLEINRPIRISNGDKIRDYLNVEIAGKEIVEIALSSYIGCANICSGQPISIREFVYSFMSDIADHSLVTFVNNDDTRLEPDYIVGVSYRKGE